MDIKAQLGMLYEKAKDLPHTLIALIVFISTLVFHWKTGRDLGPNFTASLYGMYGFLLGHGAAQVAGDAWGKKDGEGK
jgi:hypothetical protein